MQHIPLLHVFDPLCNLYKELCGLTLIQSDYSVLSRGGPIIVVGFHCLERLYLNLQFVTWHIL
jgi:hypothetical protein